MAEPMTDLVEILLTDVAAAGGEPWYPADYARATGIPREQLDASLDRLRLSGLVRLTDWVQGRGQGYMLTPEGAQVLESPRLLGRLREGRELPRRLETPDPVVRSLRQPGTTYDRGEAIRAALLDQSGPAITKALIWINVAVFGYGLWLAAQNQVADQYLGFSANEKVLRIQHDTGGLISLDLQRGQWWRLLSYCFVHGGLLHLLMNMYVLYSIGSVVEKMWGMPRYLALYLISGLGGAVLHLYVGRNPHALMVGASGCICGLLASMGVWVWLNRGFLPPRLVSDWMRNIMLNVLLIAFISMVPNVSWEGHLGGGLAGAVVAVPLNFSRFGQGAQRWLGWVGVAAVPVLCLGLLWQSARGNAPEVEVSADDPSMVALRTNYADTINGAHTGCEDAYTEHGKKFLEAGIDPSKDEQAVQKALKAFQAVRANLKTRADRLSRAGPFKNPTVQDFLERARKYVGAADEFWGLFATSLQPVENWTDGQKRALRRDWEALEAYWQRLSKSSVYQGLQE
jgi:membrane associated rhomboid family serine protease